jgi:hypothetical protein
MSRDIIFPYEKLKVLYDTIDTNGLLSSVSVWLSSTRLCSRPNQAGLMPSSVGSA